MTVVLQQGSGTTWTAPIVYHNGTRLLEGATTVVTKTASGTNAITTTSTSGFIVGSTIVFSDTMFGSVIQPFTTYYIKDILGSTQFTISATSGGSTLSLTDATGSARIIINDYAFGTQPNGIAAKIIFATNTYDNSVDYLAYSMFGETTPQQYGYALPQIQKFTGNGSTRVYNLTNFVGKENAQNAVVEINGLRVTNSLYAIDFNLNTITFTTAPALNALITVMTYNDTTRQYLNSQFGITGNTVTPISSITNTITPASAITYSTATTTGTNVITCDSTSGFAVNATVEFKGSGSLGGIQVDGTVYFIHSVLTSTTFKIKNSSGTIVDLTTATGNLQTIVGGTPAVRVTTTIANGLIENQLIRLDGTLGSIQLNNNQYYVHIINSFTFDLYTQSYNPALGATNYPVTTTSTYVSGGYVWVSGSFRIYDTTATATTYDYATSTLNSATIYNYTLIAASYSGSPIRVGMVLTGTGVVPGTTIVAGFGLNWIVDIPQIVSPTTITGTYSEYPITCASTDGFVIDTPVYFSATGAYNGSTILGGLVQGTKYYIREILSVTQFTVSATRGGPSFALTTASGSIAVAQWNQINVDRLWVTLNGKRIASSNLKVNAVNELSILTQVVAGDEVIITSMVTHGTPNEEKYINFVSPTGETAVYRANTETRTWLTHDVFKLSTEIYVNDVRTLTNVITQNISAPSVLSGYYSIGMTTDKNTQTGTTVLNNTTGNYINSDYYEIVIEALSPILKIKPGAYITTGDSLTITTLEGNTVLINGEQIKFSVVDFATNKLSGLQRGANGTGVQDVIPIYTEVYGLLSSNRLSDVYYNQTWNSKVWNTTIGDPLQISDTVPAQFLHVDIT